MWPLWRCGRAALRPCSYGGPNNNLLPLLRFVFGSTFGVVRKRLQIFLYTYLYTNIEKSKYYLRNCKILYSLVISVLCYYMKLPEIRWAIPHSPQRLAKKARQACLNASFLVSFAKPAAGGQSGPKIYSTFNPRHISPFKESVRSHRYQKPILRRPWLSSFSTLQ